MYDDVASLTAAVIKNYLKEHEVEPCGFADFYTYFFLILTPPPNRECMEV